jgi:hypothetical protein
MNLDDAFLSATHIADLAQTDIVSVHTWTTRGFADPYHAKPRVRRGGGRVRSYSMRDALRFFLMARLHKQYRLPLPQGLEICQSVFGEENFNPDKAAFLVLEQGTSRANDATWCADLNSVAARLAAEPLAAVINVKCILDIIVARTRQYRDAKI